MKKRSRPKTKDHRLKTLFAQHRLHGPWSMVYGLNKGFTLIELMVSSSILALIGLAVLTTFGSGFHVYERVQSYGGTQTDVLLALEEMERDISNTFSFSGMELEGDGKSITLPAVIETVGSKQDGEASSQVVGQISYSLGEEDQQKILLRDQWDYSQADSREKGDDEQSGFLAFVKDLTFSYYYYDGANKKYDWKDSWENEASLPMAVKVELTYEDRGLDLVITRTAFIQSAQNTEEDLEEEPEELEEGEGGEGEVDV